MIRWSTSRALRFIVVTAIAGVALGLGIAFRVPVVVLVFSVVLVGLLDSELQEHRRSRLAFYSRPLLWAGTAGIGAVIAAGALGHGPKSVGWALLTGPILERVMPIAAHVWMSPSVRRWVLRAERLIGFKDVEDETTGSSQLLPHKSHSLGSETRPGGYGD